MKHILSLGLCIGAAMMLSGCGKKGPSHESIVIDMTESAKAATEVMNGVRDEATAQRAISELKQQAVQLRVLRLTLGTLGNASPEEVQRVRRHDEKVETAVNKALQASQSMLQTVSKLVQDGQVSEVTGQEMRSVAQAFEQALKQFDDVAKKMIQ